MRNLLIIFFVVSFATVKAQDLKDSSKVITMAAIVSSKGIGLIPAFNNPTPSAFVVSNFYYKRFEIQFDYAYSLGDDGKFGQAWFSDWFVRYNHPLGKKTTATVGFDWSMYYQSYLINSINQSIHQAVRYPTGQLKLMHNFSNNFSLSADYWYTTPIEKEYGITGSYLGLIANKQSSYKKFTMNYATNFFGLSYDNGTKGLCFAHDVTLLHNKTGLFIGPKIVHSVFGKVLKPTFNVSMGISKKFNYK